jgi:formiminoglutamate deiminase
MPTLHAANALTPDGWRKDVRIEIADGRIARVAAGVAPGPADERCAILLPALPNLHCHAFQRAMAGLAERRGQGAASFWTWRETMYRIALALDPDDVEAIAAQAYVEMLESGIASVAEFHYLHHAPDGAPYANLAELGERVGAAASRAGIGLTLLPVFYAHATFGGAPPLPEQRRFINDLDRYAKLLDASRRAVASLPFAAVGVAPHSLRAATPDEIARAATMAGKNPVHIHVAEQTKEVEDCLLWSNARPVRWLLDHSAVDDRWCLVHATHMDVSETSDVANSGAVVGLCPITEANLGDGFFPAEDFLARGGRFGVGSDSNVEIGAAEELRLLEYGQRLKGCARNVFASPGGSTGRALYERALAGGAQALGRTCGRLEPGAVADLVSLKSDHPALAGRDDDAILDAWVFVGGRALIDCVWVAGINVVWNGRHHRRDAVALAFTETMKHIHARHSPVSWLTSPSA